MSAERSRTVKSFSLSLTLFYLLLARLFLLYLCGPVLINKINKRDRVLTLPKSFFSCQTNGWNWLAEKWLWEMRIDVRISGQLSRIFLLFIFSWTQRLGRLGPEKKEKKIAAAKVFERKAHSFLFYSRIFISLYCVDPGIIKKNTKTLCPVRHTLIGPRAQRYLRAQ